MELILTAVVNFGEVRRAQLAKSILLTLGIFSDLLRSVQMLKREWGAESNGSYRTHPSLVKLQPGFLSLRWKIGLWAELQPWFLSLQWRTCPWAEYEMMMKMCILIDLPYNSLTYHTYTLLYLQQFTIFKYIKYLRTMVPKLPVVTH